MGMTDDATKRAQRYLDVGPRFVRPDPLNPAGPPTAAFEKGLKPGEEPTVKGAQATATEEGKKAVEKKYEAPAAKATMMGRAAPLDELSKTVDEILASPGMEARTGLSSYLPAAVQGDDARNMQAKMENLKSQIAQNVLQMYRQMSQTGGAVGQVSNFEQKMFQNALAALDQAQTEKEFRNQLGKIKTFVAGSKERLQQAHEMQFGQEAKQDFGRRQSDEYDYVPGQGLVPRK